MTRSTLAQTPWSDGWASSSPVAALALVVLGGACALPATLVILRFVSPEPFERVADPLPAVLTNWPH